MEGYAERAFEGMKRSVLGFGNLPEEEQRELASKHRLRVRSTGVGSELGSAGAQEVVRWPEGENADMLIFTSTRPYFSLDRDMVWVIHSPNNDGTEIRALARKLLKAEGFTEEQIDAVLIDLGAHDVNDMYLSQEVKELCRRTRLERLWERGLPDLDYRKPIGQKVVVPEWEKDLRKKIAEKVAAKKKKKAPESKVVADGEEIKPENVEVAQQEPAPPPPEMQNPPYEDAGSTDQTARPKVRPALSNIDRASRYIQRRLRKYLGPDVDPNNVDDVLSQASGDEYEVYQSCLQAFQNLKFLKKSGIDWVGYKSGMTLEQLTSNVRKIRAEIEKNPSAVPPAGTPETAAFVKDAIEHGQDPESISSQSGPEEIKIPPQPPLFDPDELIILSRPQKIWRRAKTIFNRVREKAPVVLNHMKQNAPALIVGGLTGAGIRIAAQFAFAALVTTTPGVVLAIGSAVFIGALAGGSARLLTTSIWGKTEKDDPHWRSKAFLKGALVGAVGAGIGAGIAQWFFADHAVPAAQTGTDPLPSTESGAGVPQPEQTAPPSVDQGTTPSSTPQAEAPPQTQPSAPQNTTAQSSTPESSGSGQATEQVAPDVAAQAAVQGSVKDLLTNEQFQGLPKEVRKLALSENPRDIILFCKEASFKLINGPHRSTEALQAGARLIERGLDVAKTAGVENTVSKMLHADLAYLKAWGIGTDKNIEVAFGHARQAGSVMHNYGARLLKLFGRLAHG